MSDGWARVRALPFPVLSEAQLLAICERHRLPPGPFGRLPETGVVNAIYTIGDGAVLRVPKDHPGCLRDAWTESVAVPAAMASGVRTPAMLAFDESLDLVAVPFAIFEWVHVPHGWPTTDDGWRDLGRQLAIVHTGVASVPDPDGHLDDPDRWHRCEEVLDDTAVGDVELRTRLGRELQRIEPILADGWPKRFVHDDIQGPNLLFDAGTDEVWLIDWGDAGWADGALDFRRIPPEATPLVLDGYRQVTPVDDGFSQRVRWDQLGYVARRVQEPKYSALMRRMLADR